MIDEPSHCSINMDVDLSPFPKYNSFILVKDHMSKFLSERQLGRIISSYRAYNGEKKSFIASPDNMPNTTALICRHLFFPVWILLALIPEEKERSLAIENVVVEDISKTSYAIDSFCSKVGEGSLIIKKLTVVCTSSELCNINELKEQVTGLGNIKFEYIKIKVAIDSTQNFNSFLEELDTASDGADEVKIMLGHDDANRKITLNEADMDKISTRLEDDNFDAEVPILEGIYNSPHTMLGEFYDPSTETLAYRHRPVHVNKILIATLGYGYPPSIHMVPDDNTKNKKDLHKRIIEKKNMTNDTAPVYHYSQDLHPSQIIKHYTNSSFVICQTTYSNGVIANGATSKAIKWLREKWEETWKDEYDNLVVLIPYGGQYMEDEMIQIHEATNEGIIIVCAAGGMGGGVVFPAALGTVLSVGVSNRGPKGKGVDIHVSEESLTHGWLDTNNYLDNLLKNCGVAAARITGLLALLLSRINSEIDSNLTDPCNKEMASAIKNTPHYLCTRVIRKLLVNEGYGSHNPQLGYGDGEEILGDLLALQSGLLQKLADVLFNDTHDSKQGIEINDKRKTEGHVIKVTITHTHHSILLFIIY